MSECRYRHGYQAEFFSEKSDVASWRRADQSSMLQQVSDESSEWLTDHVAVVRLTRTRREPDTRRRHERETSRRSSPVDPANDRCGQS